MKSILITGAASGIGAETAKLFHTRGWQVFLTDVDGKPLQTLTAELGEHAHSRILDVRDRQGWSEVVQWITEITGGTLDVLLNNAGVAAFGDFEHVEAGKYVDLIDVNLKGVVFGSQAALTLLRATPEARIISMGSISGAVGVPGIAVYSATKWGVRGLTEALDAELSPHGVSVSNIMPWFIDTPLLDKGRSELTLEAAKVEMQAAGIPVYTAGAVAETVWTAAHGNQLHYTVGAKAAQTSWAMRWMPWLVRRRLKKGFLQKPN